MFKKWSDFFKQVFYGLNWTTDVLLPVNQNSNRTIVGVDFLKVHHFLFLALIEIDLWQVYDVSFFLKIDKIFKEFLLDNETS